MLRFFVAAFILICVCLPSLHGQGCFTWTNCSTCIQNGCGWCAELSTCQQEIGNCSRYSNTNCYWECVKYDYSCSACLEQNGAGSCGWCHGIAKAGDPEATTGARLACLNSLPGTNLPNPDYTCENWLLPPTPCPNCDKRTTCADCVAQDLCGICVPNEEPGYWQCQEGSTSASYEFCKSTGTAPSETWLIDSCAPLCPLYGTCVNCMKHNDYCSWCEQSNATIGSCLVKNPNAVCSAVVNNTAQCPGESSTPCEARVDCAECLTPGNVFQCGWCETPTVFQCVNSSLSSQCNASDWFNTTQRCPKHCPGYPLSECSGNGVCNNATQGCICNSSYFGLICNQRCLDNETCSGHGTCYYDKPSDNVICHCGQNYYGLNCEVFCDPEITCSGKGVCNSLNGACMCSDGFAPPSCLPFQCNDFSTCTLCLESDVLKNCSWCESKNECGAKGNFSSCPKQFEESAQCSSSCSNLNSAQCLSGHYCGCFWCEEMTMCLSTGGLPQKDWVSICPNYIYECKSSKKGLNGGIIALIVLVSLCVVVIVAVGLIVAYRKMSGKSFSLGSFGSGGSGYESVPEGKPLNTGGKSTFHNDQL